MSSENTPASAVRLGAGPRQVLVRPGVGAAGHIIYRSDVTTRRIVVSQATLILVEEGRKRLRWAGGDCFAGPGDALSVHPGEVLDISNTPGPSGSYRALWICWAPELQTVPGAAPATPSSRVAQHPGLQAAFKAAYHRAFDGLADTDGLPARIAVSRLQEVLLWLAERGFHFPPPAPPSPDQQVRQLLSTDPAADWTMQAVAGHSATSVATLRRRLAAQGTSFRALVQDVRMSHALSLLQNTDSPVLQVALAAGYDSPSRFTARFRARFGYLPTDIRGQHRRRN